MEQSSLLEEGSTANNSSIQLGKGLFIQIISGYPKQAHLYRHGTLIKTVNLLDKVAKRVFVVEAVELGAVQTKLAGALGITRKTIHNYCEIKKHFGTQGLIHGYTVEDSQSKRKQKELHAAQRPTGNKAQQVAEIRQQVRLSETNESSETLTFNFSDKDDATTPLSQEEQPFSQEHDWEATRYAGVGIYWVTLIAQWQWVNLIFKYFGKGWRIFSVFLLMASQNIRSIEQLKNIRSREAGRILGLERIPSKPIVWKWFYEVAGDKKALTLLAEYFRRQMKAGLTSLWLWFIDGHLLPYTGKEKTHYAYNTQRRMPVPGRTNQVTTDADGRVVDFEIQEGKGDMKSYLLSLRNKWGKELPCQPILVFDREAYSGNFFHNLVEQGTPFVTWDKHVDTAKLKVIEDERYTTHFIFNGKEYSVFEGIKQLKYGDPRNKESLPLRHIHLWNHSSNHRTCGLAWSPDSMTLSTQDCAEAILGRWGASENAFKHIQERHPFHYQPGFKIVESERQEITNPEIKKKQKEIEFIKKALGKLYKKFAKAKTNNKAGKNSTYERLQEEIRVFEEQERQKVEEKKALPDKIDVSTLQDYRSFSRIADEGKYLFDFVTTSVWNARKQMVSWLGEYYDEDNELVDLFYAITSCHGWVKSEKDKVTIRLEPIQRPKRRAAQEQFCRKLNSLGTQLPNGKWIIIEVGDSPI